MSLDSLHFYMSQCASMSGVRCQVPDGSTYPTLSVLAYLLLFSSHIYLTLPSLPYFMVRYRELKYLR